MNHPHIPSEFERAFRESLATTQSTPIAGTAKVETLSPAAPWGERQIAQLMAMIFAIGGGLSETPETKSLAWFVAILAHVLTFIHSRRAEKIREARRYLAEAVELRPAGISESSPAKIDDHLARLTAEVEGQQRNECERLRAALKEAHEGIAIAYQVACRNGTLTNWIVFREHLESLLQQQADLLPLAARIYQPEAGPTVQPAGGAA